MPTRRYQRLPPPNGEASDVVVPIKHKKRKTKRATTDTPPAPTVRERDLAEPHNLEDLDPAQMRALAEIIGVDIPEKTRLEVMYALIEATGIAEPIDPALYEQLPWSE